MTGQLTVVRPLTNVVGSVESSLGAPDVDLLAGLRIPLAVGDRHSRSLQLRIDAAVAGRMALPAALLGELEPPRAGTSGQWSSALLAGLLAGARSGSIPDAAVTAAAIIQMLRIAVNKHAEVRNANSRSMSASLRRHNSLCILVGDLVFARISSIAADSGQRVVEALAQSLARITEGEIMDRAAARSPVAGMANSKVLYPEPLSLVAAAVPLARACRAGDDAGSVALDEWGMAVARAVDRADCGLLVPLLAGIPAGSRR